MSFSRQMSRARFFDLRNSIAFGLADIGGGVYQPRGSGGNPMLRPYLAKQFDFGYEHYFGSTGLFQAGVFYKWLASFVGGERKSVASGQRVSVRVDLGVRRLLTIQS